MKIHGACGLSDVPDVVGVLPNGKKVELVHLAPLHLQRLLQCRPLASTHLALAKLALPTVRTTDVVHATVVPQTPAARGPVELPTALVLLQDVTRLVLAFQFEPPGRRPVRVQSSVQLGATMDDVARLGLVLELKLDRPGVVGFGHCKNLRTSPGAAYWAHYGEGAGKPACLHQLQST